MNEIDKLFPDQKPYVPEWRNHTVTVILPSGKSLMPELKFECREASDDSSPCTSYLCSMEDLYKQVGWDCLKIAGEIELTRLSAKVDWSDPEEPWIEVEP